MRRLLLGTVAVAVVLALYTFGCGPMPRAERLRDERVGGVQRLTISNLSVDPSIVVKSDEDVDVERRIGLARSAAFGYEKELLRAAASSSFKLNSLSSLASAKNYAGLHLPRSYTRTYARPFPELRLRLPGMRGPEHEFISADDRWGAVPPERRAVLNGLKLSNIDALLSIELSYQFDVGAHIPFSKPRWTATVEVLAEVYSSDGTLLWQYWFNTASNPMPASSAATVIVASESRIDPERIGELTLSADHNSADALLRTLTADVRSSSRSWIIR